jgi:hypothetical protein
MDRKALVNHTSAEIADGIGQLHALCAHVHRQLLEFIAAYDEKEAWAEDGATSMASWVAAALGLGHETAAEWMRVTGALGDLPSIGSAYDEGGITKLACCG